MFGCAGNEETKNTSAQPPCSITADKRLLSICVCDVFGNADELTGRSRRCAAALQSLQRDVHNPTLDFQAKPVAVCVTVSFSVIVAVTVMVKS